MAKGRLKYYVKWIGSVFWVYLRECIDSMDILSKNKGFWFLVSPTGRQNVHQKMSQEQKIIKIRFVGKVQ